MKDVKIAVAGRGTMGMPLLQRLEREGFEVPVSFTSRKLYINQHYYPRADETAPLTTSELDAYMKSVDVMFIAIPSGPHELPLIKYCIARNIYAILFCKHALACKYDELRPHRHMIGANATVGGRTMTLPWLRMQHLERKKFVLYAYWNASTNFFMHGAADNNSAPTMFEKAKAWHLAEPGSDDYASFLNTEIGGDYPYKISIAMNDAMIAHEFCMSPKLFDTYVKLDKRDVRALTLPTRNLRYLIRIDNIGLDPEPDFERGKPGSLYARLGKFTVYGGFFDMSRNTHLSSWIKGGESNGVQIRFEEEDSDEGTVEMAGLGAGPATVGAAMNDLYQFLKAREGMLLEDSWPARRPKWAVG